MSEQKNKKHQCALEGCHKKRSNFNFVCRCEKQFCDIHRMPETHKCTYDYKTHGRNILNNSLNREKKVIVYNNSSGGGCAY